MSTKISELPSLVGSIPSGNDVPISSSGTTYRFTLGDISTINASDNSALSAPVVKLSGSWVTGGTSTTNKPHFLIEPAGTTSTSWSTTGTGIGLNAASGFVGDVINLLVNNASVFKINYIGSVSVGNSGSFTHNAGAYFTLNAYHGLCIAGSAGAGSGIMGIKFSNSSNPNTGYDSMIYRSSAGTLDIIDGTVGTFRDLRLRVGMFFGTYTSSTSYERLCVKYDAASTSFQIGTEKGSGGGVARNLDLVRDGVVKITISSGSVDIISAASVAGNLTFTGGYEIRAASYNSFGIANAKLVWPSGSSPNVGIDYVSSGIIGVGNGTAGDSSGKIQAAGFITSSSAINAQTGTTYTLLSSDNGKIVKLTNASAITVTVPAGLPVGFSCQIVQGGAGDVTIAASGTTVNSYGSLLTIAGQYASASLFSDATNTFILAGNLK